MLASVYLNLDSLPEEIIDELAWQFHVDFYDVGSDVVAKRKLVQDCILIHRKKGTPFAVKKLILDVFGTAELKEWFDYSGDPYTFRVAVDYSPEVATDITRFHNLVDSVKNIRSKLEAIELTFRTNIGITYEIYKRNLTRHTKLGVWKLGVDPFATVGSEVQIK
jgi:phage tail P2-like protein